MDPNFPALVGIAHGTSSPLGVNAVQMLMASVIKAHPELTMTLGFVDVQRPDTREALDSLEPGLSAIVVPLLLSAGFHVHVDLTKTVNAQTDRKVRLAKALGPDHRLINILQHRLAEVGLSSEDQLILAVAGSSDKRAIADCNLVASALAASVNQAVTLGFLSAAKPSLVDAITAARAQHPKKRIVVSSYLLAPGYFHTLVENAGADVVTSPLLVADGPTPWQLVEVVIDRYIAVLERE